MHVYVTINNPVFTIFLPLKKESMVATVLNAMNGKAAITIPLLQYHSGTDAYLMHFSE